MNRRRIIIIIAVALVLLCVLIYSLGGSPTDEETPLQLPEPTNTAVEIAVPTNTSAPAPTERIGVINCPECGDVALILWVEIDDIGAGGGKVMHGDTCIIIDQGITDGIEKYRLNCDGKIGWLRSEGVQEQ
jgi:hypothetical protein